MQSLNFKKDKLTFTGTYQEFIDALQLLDFWEREEDYERFISAPQETARLAQFGTYCADIKAGVLFEQGVGYIGGKKPTYPDITFMELKTEGYSQEEINQAFGKALNELEKMNKREKGDTKAFILKKLTV